MDFPQPLSEVIANRRWLQRAEPFPHIVADDVFTPSFYRELEIAFQEVLTCSFGSQGSARQTEMAGRGFVRGMRGYDAYGLNFSPDVSGPFTIFVSRPWHDMLANLAGVKATGHVNCGLHHHSVNSTNGHVHHDLNPGWFADYESPDGIKLARHELCGYTTGETYHPGVAVQETVRAAAMLFYLNNPPWSPGDGGGTGLYRNATDPVSSPEMMVPPANNSLLLFRCTPHSYHTFLSNYHHPRNSVIMWLHQSKTDVTSRWGEGAIVGWR